MKTFYFQLMLAFRLLAEVLIDFFKGYILFILPIATEILVAFMTGKVLISVHLYMMYVSSSVFGLIMIFCWIALRRSSKNMTILSKISLYILWLIALCIQIWAYGYIKGVN